MSLGFSVERGVGGTAFRMGIHNGYDLSTRQGLTKAMETIRRLKPRNVHVSPPCHPWTTLSNAWTSPQQQEALKSRRKHSRRILGNCLKLIQLQRQELQGQSGVDAECHAGGEHPLRAMSWKEPSLRRMVKLCGDDRFRCDGCRFGMKSVKDGRFIQKPWGWLRACAHG